METPSGPDAVDEGGRRENCEPTPVLPTITHLQFLVLDALTHQRQGTSATALRETLRAYGEDREGPQFYQLMRRLEESHFIESWFQSFDVGGGEVSRTYYRVAPQGRVAWRLTIEFYASRLQASRTLLDGCVRSDTPVSRKRR